MNSTLFSDLDRLIASASDADLKTILGEIAKRVMAKQPAGSPFELRDMENHAVGYLVSNADVQGNFPTSEEEFIELAKQRIENPSERMVSIEEFFAILDRD